MKTKFIFRILTVIVLILSLTVNIHAQYQNAGLNSTFTYKTTQSVATGVSTFTWNIYDHGTANLTDAANYSVVSGAGTANFKIQWKVNGDYDVVVREISSNGCSDPTTDKLRWIQVGTNSINLASYTNTPGCWSSTDGSLSFSFAHTPGASDYPIIVAYTVALNGAAATNGSVTLNSSADPLTISVPGFLNNTTTGDVTNVVTLTGATINGGATISLGTTTSASQTVYAKPATNGITVE